MKSKANASRQMISVGGPPTWGSELLDAPKFLPSTRRPQIDNSGAHPPSEPGDWVESCRNWGLSKRRREAVFPGLREPVSRQGRLVF